MIIKNSIWEIVENIICSVRLETAYLIKAENFFVENVENKMNIIVGPMNNIKKYSETHE